MPYVKNKKETSEENPPNGYKSWIEFWEKKRKKQATRCECCNKKHDNLHGGHVYKPKKATRKIYITPICSECNHYTNRNKFFVLKKDLIFLRREEITSIKH